MNVEHLPLILLIWTVVGFVFWWGVVNIGKDKEPPEEKYDWKVMVHHPVFMAEELMRISHERKTQAYVEAAEWVRRFRPNRKWWLERIRHEDEEARTA